MLSILCYAVHLGRDKIVDFHWNSSDPWTIVSVSDDGESTGGGGTLQVLLFLESVKIWCKPQDKIKLYLQQDLYDYVLLSVLTVFVFGADMAHE
jgi:hypothetical protein